MNYSAHTILVGLALIFAVLSLVPNFSGILLTVAVILLAIADFVK